MTIRLKYNEIVKCTWKYSWIKWMITKITISLFILWYICCILRLGIFYYLSKKPYKCITISLIIWFNHMIYAKDMNSNLYGTCFDRVNIWKVFIWEDCIGAFLYYIFMKAQSRNNLYKTYKWKSKRKIIKENNIRRQWKKYQFHTINNKRN